MKSSSKHWDTIFSNTEDAKLGWYEKDASKTMELLNKIPKWENSTVFLTGAGTSVLIEELHDKVGKLILNDISVEALNKVKKRLRKQKCKDIIWLCQDIAQPIRDKIPATDIWIDRAVLHFLNDESDIKGYFDNLKSVLKNGGHALFAEFSKIGAPKCAGLPVHRYSVEELSERLGNEFIPIEHHDYTFLNPWGDPRPYIYALYQKENKKNG